MRRYHGQDKNQEEIVNELKKAGYEVADTSVTGYGYPDITVRSKTGIIVIIEIKYLRRGLNKNEIRFHKSWGESPVHVARDSKTALDIMRYYDHQYIVPSQEWRYCNEIIGGSHHKRVKSTARAGIVGIQKKVSGSNNKEVRAAVRRRRKNKTG